MTMRRPTRSTALRLVLLALVLLVAPLVGARSAAAAPVRCFAETGRCIVGAFLAYWDAHGALAQQGLPLTDEMYEQDPLDGRTYRVQYFERARFEYHPENPAPYDLLLGRLGDEQYRARYPDGRPTGGAGDTCFLETGRCVRGVFATYWAAHGGLAQQGLPLSDEFDEVNPADGRPYRVQYFERARFEYHPEHAAPDDVLLGLLGREQLAARFPGYTPVLGTATACSAPGDTPPDTVATSEPGVPTRLLIPALGLDAPVEAVGVNSDGAMSSAQGPCTVAWYAPGPRPGLAGNAVMAGKRAESPGGSATFWNLPRLVPGDIIGVVDERGATRHFVVTRLAVYDQDAAPLQEIFGSTTGSHLNLITGLGPNDTVTHRYVARLIVYTDAVP
jgi:hypothetical protein